ncbi:DNA-binding protein [Microbacterium oxydans]|uniref:DNA-binding protein n=1 Tax=Microbacterium oxydans TaxID=82380 RepID=UPI000F8F9F42|nr:DNA-binding protein [Microbacterium oxydans]AZS46658.1 hypothetical protein CVS53_01332 [Microbacterium oxydans]
MKEWLTLREAAAVAGRTERTIRNWIAAGELSQKYGRFARDEVLAVEKRMRRRVGRPRKGIERQDTADAREELGSRS